MFYFSQIVKLKKTGEELAYKGLNGDVYVFDKNGTYVEFLASKISKNDFEEIWETVSLFGKIPVKRLKRMW